MVHQGLFARPAQPAHHRAAACAPLAPRTLPCALQGLHRPHIIGLPHARLSWVELTEAGQDPDCIPELLSDVRAHLGVAQDSPLIIKPVHDGGSSGVMVIEDDYDLMMYAAGVGTGGAAVTPEEIPSAPQFLLHVCGAWWQRDVR